MARKDELKLDNFDLDRDLDFDNFSFDDIDGMLSEESKSKKRSPVHDTFRGVVKGTVKELTSPSLLAKVMKKSLPEQYGEVASSADKALGDFTSLYDDTIRELKPQMSRIARKIDKLVPEESKFFKKISTKFKDIIGEEFEAYRGQSTESIQEQNIANTISSIFKAQADTDAEEKAKISAEDKVRDRIEDKRFATNNQLFSSIDRNLAITTDYTTKITQAYQKKSLELQFRSYFTQSQLLKTTERFYDIFKNQNESIVKNTALPEFVKIKESERFKEIAKNRLYSGIQNSFFGNSNMFSVAGERLKSNIKTQIEGFKQGMEAAMMGLETIEMTRETADSLGDSGFSGESKQSIYGELAGGQIGSFLGNKLAKLLRSRITEGSDIEKSGYKYAEMAKNLSAYTEKFRKSDYIKNAESEDNIFGMLLGNVLDLFRPNAPSTRIGEAEGFSSLEQPGIFNNKTNRSITEVIPGYLSMILREIKILRTKDESIAPMIYDYESSKFRTEKDMAKKFGDIFNRKTAGSFKIRLDSTIDSLAGDIKLTDKKRVELRKFLSRLSQTDTEYSPEAIYETEAFKSSKSKKLIRSLLDKNITGSSYREKSQYEFTGSMGSIRDNMPDFRAEIDNAVRLGYGNILEDEGLIKQLPDGSYEIQMDAYNELMDKELGVVSSDIRVKRNIKPINPKDALTSIKKTKIYDWLYKLGKGDKKPHTGPMAQDVNEQMGEEAAPDGTKIDLTTMNGINMAAIQALDNKINSENSDDSISILKQIKEDTGKLVDILSGGESIGGINISKNKSYSGMLGNIIDYTLRSGEKIFSSITNGLEFGKDKIAKPTLEFLSKKISDNKDRIGESFSKLFSSAADLATGAMKVGNDLLFDKLPKGMQSVRNSGKWLYNKAKEIIEGPIDVYIRDKSGERRAALRANLMKIGYYFDQKSGKVIKSISDIKGPVVDKFGKLVLDVEDIANGLSDVEGKPIRTFFEKIASKAWDTATSLYGETKNVFSSLGNVLKPSDNGILGKAKDSIFGKRSSLSGDKVYNVLVEIRDILKNQYGEPGTFNNASGPEEVIEEVNTEEPDVNANADLSPRYRSGNSSGLLSRGLDIGRKAGKGILSSLPGFKKGKGFKGKASALFGGIASAFSSNDEQSKMPTDNFVGPMPQSNEDHETDQEPVHETIKKYIKNKAGKAKAAWNDRDASGRRDGSWRDRLDDLQRKAKEKKDKFLKADLSLKYKSSENVIDTMMKKAGGFFDFLKGGIGSIFDKSGGLFETVLAGLGLNKLKGIGGKILGLGKKGLEVMKNLPGAIKSVGNIVKTGGIASRVLSAGNMARNAFLATSFMSSGALSAVTGMAGTALTAAGAFLASPVALASAAVAAVGYGGYKAYKFFTRDRLDNYQLLRLYQYGLLNSGRDKHHNHEIVELEEYLLDDSRIVYAGGKAFINPRSIDANDLYDMFSIDSSDEENVEKFNIWFNSRFKPFFLTHLTALYSINDKIKLSEIDSLSKEEQSRYLSLVSFESGPYNEDTSPFKDVDYLNNDKSLAIEYIKGLTNQISKELDSKSYKDAQKKAKDINDLKKDTVKSTSNAFLSKALNKVKQKDEDKDSIARRSEEIRKLRQEPSKSMSNSFLERAFNKMKGQSNITASNQGEDGNIREPNKVSIDRQVLGPAVSTKLTVATGPMSDGANGMQFIRLEPGVTLNGVNPELMKNFLGMVQEYGETTGKSIVVTSGYRSTVQQAALYRRDPKKAAPPGRSLHEFGLALDVNSKDLNELEKLGLMRKYGFTRPVGGEPWHTEAAGIQSNIKKAKKDPNWASERIALSLNHGGGGLGTVKGAKKWSRDTSYAMNIINQINQSKVDLNKGEDDNFLSGKATDIGQSSIPENKSKDNVVLLDSFRKNLSAEFDDGTNNVANTKGSVDGGKSFDYAETYSKNQYTPDVEGSQKQGFSSIAKGPLPKGKEEIKKLIHDVAMNLGLDPNMMTVFGAIESSLNPNAGASTSSAKGLFQFTKSTWREQLEKHGRKYGFDKNTSPFNPRANAIMGGEYVKSNVDVLKKVKSNITATDIYMAHFLGPNGAKQMLSSNPNAIAAKILPAAARANRGLFYKNGRALTVAEFYQGLNNLVNRRAKEYGIPMTAQAFNNPLEDENGNSTGETITPISGIDTATNESKGIGDIATQNAANDSSLLEVSSDTSKPTSSPGYGSSVSNIYQQPNVFGQSSYDRTNQGQSMNFGSLDKGIDKMTNVLNDQLSVQKQILDVLGQIVSNVTPENAESAKEGLKQVANQVRSSSQVSKPAVDLSRKAV